MCPQPTHNNHCEYKGCMSELEGHIEIPSNLPRSMRNKDSWSRNGWAQLLGCESVLPDIHQRLLGRKKLFICWKRVWIVHSFTWAGTVKVYRLGGLNKRGLHSHCLANPTSKRKVLKILPFLVSISFLACRWGHKSYGNRVRWWLHLFLTQ